VTTKEEITESLREQMKDPSLSSAMFDEYDRRIKLLDSEE
jgi:hypothetical protein